MAALSRVSRADWGTELVRLVREICLGALVMLLGALRMELAACWVVFWGDLVDREGVGRSKLVLEVCDLSGQIVNDVFFRLTKRTLFAGVLCGGK